MLIRPACDVLRDVLRPFPGAPPELSFYPQGMPSLRIRLRELVDDGSGRPVSRELRHEEHKTRLEERAEAALEAWAGAFDHMAGVASRVIQLHTPLREAPPVEIPSLVNAVRLPLLRGLSPKLRAIGAYAHCDIMRRPGQPLQVQSLRFTPMGGGQDEWCDDEGVRLAFERWSEAAAPLLGQSMRLVFLMNVPAPSAHERMQAAAWSAGSPHPA